MNIDDLPPPPRFKDFPQFGDWLFKVWRCIKALQPLKSVGTFTTHTDKGVFRQTRPQQEQSDGGTGPVWL